MAYVESQAKIRARAVSSAKLGFRNDTSIPREENPRENENETHTHIHTLWQRLSSESLLPVVSSVPSRSYYASVCYPIRSPNASVRSRDDCFVKEDEVVGAGLSVKVFWCSLL